MKENLFQNLSLENQGHVAVLTITRPKVLNALNADVVKELLEALERVEKSPEIRAMIITGAGDRAFVAGADIAAMKELSVEAARVFALRGHAIGNKIAKMAIPVIAAVNGFALGGGCELALACDFIYASEKALFGQPEVKLGLIPGFGGTQRLIRRVGPGQALELVMAGNHLRADEALRIGLVNKVLPAEELMDAAMKTANAIAANAPLAVARAKEVTRLGAEITLDTANLLEVEAFATLFASEDSREGMGAFVEKRKASFKGS